jgi:segregation and condensation protein A|tara:strand:- start:67 stop:804 length:738 start_codon:yes stop_codon:yes gene_type:complete
MSDSNTFNVDLNNFSGPLDVLLDLAKSQKVNLEKISITKLADQFIDFIKNAKNVNLELASEYLLMATWLTYLKSKLLLPESEEEEFKALEVAEKLKLQLKKLELIRLLSDQMLKKKRLGKDVFLRGMKGSIRSINSYKYSLSLFEILKTYSTVVMTKDFQKINIPKLPVFTTEDGIHRIKDFLDKLSNWKNLNELIPKNFENTKKLRRSGIAGILAGSLEMVKEGSVLIKQNNLYDEIFIKKTNE